MKPEPKQEDSKEEPELAAIEPPQPPITGDVIGDTAYSERFVLKILLKFANLDTLKDELQERSFEEDLCILWDMTAEKDVVEFLQKHSTLKLFLFALPTIKSERIIEIVLGIIGNMCCVKDVVTTLLGMDELLTIFMEYLKTLDVSILTQVLRLVNSCLYVAEGEDIAKWFDIFQNVDYTVGLNYILINSTNKGLLINALENFNTICSQCNIEQYRSKFFTHFVNVPSLEALSSAFTELTSNHEQLCEKEEFERILVVTLQIILNLIGFNTSSELYKDKRKHVLDVIKYIFSYSEDKFVNDKQIDLDLIDIVDSVSTAVNVLELSSCSDLEQYFDQSYSMWKMICSILRSDTNGTSSEDSPFSNTNEDVTTTKKFAKDLQTPLCSIMCNYMQHCDEKYLFKVLDTVGNDYNNIVNNCNEKDVKVAICKRVENYRTRIDDNVDS